MANLKLKLSGQHSAAILKSSLAQSSNKSHLPSWLSALGEAIGPFEAHASLQILNGDDAAASGIITILDYTKMTANDTYQIGSLVLTAKSSGATGAQFNIGASNNASASNLAAAITANGAGLVKASASAAIVTVSAMSSGPLGNAIAIIITQATPGSASSAAALSGGANDSAVGQDYRSF